MVVGAVVRYRLLLLLQWPIVDGTVVDVADKEFELLLNFFCSDFGVDVVLQFIVSSLTDDDMIGFPFMIVVLLYG